MKNKPNSKRFYRRRIFWIVMIALILIVPTILIVIWQGSQKPKSSINNDIPEFIQAAVEVPKEQAVLISMQSGSLTINPGDVLVFIPAGALNKKGSVSIISREADILAEAGDPGWSRPYVVNLEYKDSEGNVISDLIFHTPVEICFVLNEVYWQDYKTRGNIFQVQMYDEGQSPPKWVRLPFVEYKNRSQLCGETTHFSLFSLAVKYAPTPTPEIEDATVPTQTSTLAGPYEP